MTESNVQKGAYAPFCSFEGEKRILLQISQIQAKFSCFAVQKDE
jgi:hypothetical protein